MKRRDANTLWVDTSSAGATAISSDRDELSPEMNDNPYRRHHVSKRSRITGVSHYAQAPAPPRDADETSAIEIYTIQLFTLILTKSEKNNDDITPISSAFKKLTDFISMEQRCLEHYESHPSPSLIPVNSPIRESRKTPNAPLNGRRSGSTFNEPVDMTGEKTFSPPHSGVRKAFNVLLSGSGKTFNANSSLIKFDLSQKIFTTSSSLTKFNNMMFLSLGYCLPKTEQYYMPRFYVNPDYVPLSFRSMTIINYSTELIHLLHQYNTKRSQICTSNTFLHKLLHPFEISQDETKEFVMILYQVLYHAISGIECILTQSKDGIENNKIPTDKIIDYVSSIESCLYILITMQERGNLIQDETIILIIFRIVSDVQRHRNGLLIDTPLENRFETLAVLALSLLRHISHAHPKSYVNIHTCAELVFHLDEESDSENCVPSDSSAQKVEIHYASLLQLLSTMNNKLYLQPTKCPNWNDLFDVVTIILQTESSQVKNILTLCSYLTYSNAIRASLLAHRSMIHTIARKASIEAFTDTPKNEINLINIDAIRLLTFLTSSADFEETRYVVDALLQLTTVKTSIQVKAEFILCLELVIRNDMSQLIAILKALVSEHIISFYNMYVDIVKYNGAGFETLLFARKAAIESMFRIYFYCNESEPDVCPLINDVLTDIIENMSDRHNKYEEVKFIEVVSNKDNQFSQKVPQVMKHQSTITLLSRISCGFTHDYETKENAMLILKAISQVDDVLQSLILNKQFLECIVHYLSFPGRSEKASLMRYCALEIGVNLASSRLCRHIIVINTRVVSLLENSAHKLPTDFESSLSDHTRTKGKIQIPPSKELSLKSRLLQCMLDLTSI